MTCQNCENCIKCDETKNQFEITQHNANASLFSRPNYVFLLFLFLIAISAFL